MRNRTVGVLAFVLGGLGCVTSPQGCFEMGANGGSSGEMKSWEAPLSLQQGSQDAEAPRVAISAGGDAVAVWQQDDGTRFQLYSNRFVSGVGWSGAEPVEAQDRGDATHHRVAMDDAGDAVVVWQYADGSAWTNRMMAGAGWGAPEPLEDDGGTAIEPRIAMNGEGDAVAVWQERSASSGGLQDQVFLWARRYVPGSGWASPQVVASGAIDVGYPDVRGAEVAIDAAGNAIVIFERAGVASYLMTAERNVPGAAWSPPEQIEPAAVDDMKEPSLAMDPAGDAVALWLSPSHASNFAARFAPDTGWEVGQAVNDGYPTGVAIGGDASAIAVWAQGGVGVSASRSDPGAGWSAAESIQPETLGAAVSLAPRVAMDDDGCAVTVWVTSPAGGTAGADQLWFDAFDPDDGWGTAEPLERVGSGEIGEPDLAMNHPGQAVAVWTEYDGGSGRVWASIYR